MLLVARSQGHAYDALQNCSYVNQTFFSEGQEQYQVYAS